MSLLGSLFQGPLARQSRLFLFVYLFLCLYVPIGIFGLQPGPSLRYVRLKGKLWEFTVVSIILTVLCYLSILQIKKGLLTFQLIYLFISTSPVFVCVCAFVCTCGRVCAFVCVCVYVCVWLSLELFSGEEQRKVPYTILSGITYLSMSFDTK